MKEGRNVQSEEGIDTLIRRYPRVWTELLIAVRAWKSQVQEGFAERSRV